MNYPISPIKERKKDGPRPLCYAKKLLKPQLSFSPPASKVIGKRDERKEERGEKKGLSYERNSREWGRRVGRETKFYSFILFYEMSKNNIY